MNPRNQPKQAFPLRWAILAGIGVVTLVVGFVLAARYLSAQRQAGEEEAQAVTQTAPAFEAPASPTKAPATQTPPPTAVTPTHMPTETVPPATAATTGPSPTAAQLGTPLPNLTPTAIEITATPSRTPTLVLTGIGPTPTVTPVVGNLRRVTSLAQLGGLDDNIELVSPSSSESVFFTFPAGWALSPTSAIELRYDVVYTGSFAMGSLTPLPGATPLPQVPALLDVLVDDQRVMSIQIPPLSVQAQSVLVPIPPGTFNIPERRNHDFTFVLNAAELCELPVELRVTIDRLSPVNLDYSLIPPTPDLASYPRPFFNLEYDPERVLIVLADQPTLGELQAAAAFAANIGARTGGRLLIDVLRAGEVSAARLAQGNMVLIGQPATHALIRDVYQRGNPPTRLSTSTLNVTVQVPEDSPFEYRITLTNRSNITLNNLRLDATLPPDIQAEACSGGCRSTGEGLVWLIPSLSANEELILTVRLPPRADAPANRTGLYVVARQGDVVLGMTHSGLTSVDNKTLILSGTTTVGLDEGVVQELISPYNSQYVILMLTGLSDEAILRAVHGLSSTVTPRFLLRGPLAIIREVLPEQQTLTVRQQDVITLGDLLFGDQTIYGVNQQYIDLFFTVPETWELTDEAIARILFAHSAAINEDLSVMTVSINGIPAGSVRLDRTNVQNGVLEVAIPPSRIFRGTENQLRITVDMDLQDECVPPETPLAWTTISRDSSIRLAHRDAPPQVLIPRLDTLMQPFSNTPNLSDTILVLPEPASSRDIAVLLQLAARMGNESGGAIFKPQLTFARLVPADALPDSNLVLLGVPSTNELIEAVNQALPQPFDLERDTISQQVGDVIYQLPEGFSVGVIQIASSPFAGAVGNRAVLVISGSGSQGYEWARRAVLEPTLFAQLEGDLAFISDLTVESFVSTNLARLEAALLGTPGAGEAGIVPMVTLTAPGAGLTPTVETPMPTLDPNATPTLPPGYEPVPPERPAWLDVVTIGAGVLVLVVLGVALIQARRRAKGD